MKKHFKIIRGYGAEDYISIREDELEKAFYAFLAKKDAVYSGGAVRGSEIIAIQPDFHATMGWNRGYKLGADDYAELRERGVESSHAKLLAHTKEKVQYLIETSQVDLIGKNADVNLPPPKEERIGGMKSIGDIKNRLP